MKVDYLFNRPFFIYSVLNINKRIKVSDNKVRCKWCLNSPIDQEYHDLEWGVPVYDDRKLFEMLCLEGMQAGLSWHIILKKRKRYIEVFDNFEATAIINYTEEYKNTLLQDKGIIRNKLKVNAIITNAKAFLEIQKEFDSFKNYIWQFTDHKIIQTNRASHHDIPASNELSDIMSKDLKKRGFKFIGTTICYAFMQGVGMINDHTKDCFRYKDLII